MASKNDFVKMREQLHRQMLSVVSHDLKTPLSTVIGSLEVYRRMENNLTKEKRDALINSALLEAYRLDNFITNILDMARLENSMVKVRLETCNLGNLVNDCIIRLGPRRSTCKITLQPIGEEEVSADPMLFSRAISLVLDNAAKYGGENPVIQVLYGRNGDGPSVRVRDHGPGLPRGKEEEIFSKYTRYTKADQKNAGTGLGLAICKELMAAQGGSVMGETLASGGALFTLRLPA